MHTLRNLLFTLLCLLSMAVLAGPAVNINTADSDTLVSGLVGVGPQKAMAIVRHRQQYGPFKHVDDLALVNGIGDKTVEQNRKNISVGKPVAK